MKKLTMILVALAAMLALAAPAMAQDPIDTQQERDTNANLAQQLEQGTITLEEACQNPDYFQGNCRGVADTSSEASASASASVSASASPSASASSGATPSASASASPSQQQYSAPEKPSATLPETGGPKLLLLLSGLAIVMGGVLFGYLVRS